MFVFSLPISSLNRVTELLRNIITTFWWIGHHRRGLTDGKYKGARKLAPCLYFGIKKSRIYTLIKYRKRSRGFTPLLLKFGVWA